MEGIQARKGVPNFRREICKGHTAQGIPHPLCEGVRQSKAERIWRLIEKCILEGRDVPCKLIDIIGRMGEEDRKKLEEWASELETRIFWDFIKKAVNEELIEILKDDEGRHKIKVNSDTGECTLNNEDLRVSADGEKLKLLKAKIGELGLKRCILISLGFESSHGYGSIISIISARAQLVESGLEALPQIKEGIMEFAKSEEKSPPKCLVNEIKDYPIEIKEKIAEFLHSKIISIFGRFMHKAKEDGFMQYDPKKLEEIAPEFGEIGALEIEYPQEKGKLEEIYARLGKEDTLIDRLEKLAEECGIEGMVNVHGINHAMMEMNGRVGKLVGLAGG